MRVVPVEAPLEVQAYITNEDIGFVHKGQFAVIKVDSFPFTRFGTIDAEVTNIAYDAVPADQANHAVTDASKSNQETSIAPTATPMTDLVFQATLNPKVIAIDVGGTAVPLTPGMTVTVEIKTGQRFIVSYIVEGVVELGNSFHER